MTQRVMAAPLGIIDPDNLEIDERYCFSVLYEMFPNKTVRVFTKGNFLWFIQYIGTN